MLDGILQGLSTAVMPMNIMMVIVGCFVGTFIGMLPGLGPISAIALMIPITYGLEPSSGLILMAGVYYGAVFGGSTSSILINAPGCSSTVVTAFDGYPMAQKGQAGKALALAAYSSFTGGTLSAIMLLVAAPALANVSLSFQSSDYFALMLLGLSAVAAFAGKGQVIKAWMMTILGLMLSTVGIDKGVGVERFTFGLTDLMDGFSFLLLAMATFALGETLMGVLKPSNDTRDEEQDKLSNIGSMKVTKEEIKEVAPVSIRSSILGFFTGVLPGAGTTAIMLGALIAYGIQPGPRLFVEHPDVFWSVIISMYFGNIVLVILNLPLIPYISKLLAVPRTVLLPMILFFSITGVYLVSFNTMDVFVMLLVAMAAIALRLANFPLAPLLLGFILGGLMEENLRRALMISDGELSFLWERPITLTFTVLAVLVLGSPLFVKLFQKLKAQPVKVEQ
ncbi:tripartite tricarboxylate transporter permease [Vibrio parahaemolyticus]|uniref:tripartite tricarboxylate transporter permease n=1 Tax=Vibrio parahaemolyticus TaxID=670 RepID=UPI00215BCF98|nr:tripartite tricarboxylate transporter permease [Vibrio parahaemolyticus]MCR9833884.1 tripartite tricarboxylate transporter permease [Vibrio parahaemolyticus]